MDSNLCYLTVKHILGLPVFRTPRNCSVGCPVTWLANGICENECNVADCGYDALDCDDGTFADKVGSLRLSSWDLTVTLSTSSPMSVNLAKRYSFQLGRYLPTQKFSMVVSCLHVESVILILPSVYYSAVHVRSSIFLAAYSRVRLVGTFRFYCAKLRVEFKLIACHIRSSNSACSFSDDPAAVE